MQTSVKVFATEIPTTDLEPFVAHSSGSVGPDYCINAPDPPFRAQETSGRWCHKEQPVPTFPKRGMPMHCIAELA